MVQQVDVLVCGAGTAGIPAALAAARMGIRTRLIDRADSLGGTISRAFVYPLMTFHASPQHQVVAGIGQELVDLAVDHGWSPGHQPDLVGTAATLTPLEPADFARCASELLDRSAVEVSLNTPFGNVVKVENAWHIALCHEGSPEEVRASVIIDATGNGDLAVAAGADYTYGRLADQMAQPMTQMFVMANVDHEKIRAYIAAHPHEFALAENALQHLSDYKWLAVSGFFSIIRQVREQHAKLQFRDRVLYFQMKDNRAALNMTRVLAQDGTDPLAVRQARQQGLQQVQECVSVLQDFIPGFEHAVLESIAPELGIRETRHIHGDYELTGLDVITGKKFADGIACGAFPIDIHSPDGEGLQITQMPAGTYYNIPYRALLPQGVDSLLLAGRCISATHEASASARVTPTSMALGQAAGVAAALSVRQRCQPRNLDPNLVRAALTAQGALVE